MCLYILIRVQDLFLQERVDSICAIFMRPLGAFKQFEWDNVTNIVPIAQERSLD